MVLAYAVFRLSVGEIYGLARSGLTQTDHNAVQAVQNAMNDTERVALLEVWSGFPEGGNVTKAVLKNGERAIAVGYGTDCDLHRAQDRHWVREMAETVWRPRLLLLSPTCAPWGAWARLNLHHGGRAAATVRARRAQEWSQVVFCRAAH